MGKIEGISYKLDNVAFQGRQLRKDYSWTGLKSVFVQEHNPQPIRDDLTPPQQANTQCRFAFAVSNTNTNNPDRELNELERQKKALRDKYVRLASLVRQYPQFHDKEARYIDIGVMLLSLKSGDNLGETQIILTQSDRVKQWHQELPREAYLKIAREYIRQITNRATELIEEHHFNPKSAQLER